MRLKHPPEGSRGSERLSAVPENPQSRRFSASGPDFAELAKALEVDDALYEKLKKMILDEPATFLREGDVIRSEADPELTQLRSMRDHAGDLLLAMEAREKSVPASRRFASTITA